MADPKTLEVLKSNECKSIINAIAGDFHVDWKLNDNNVLEVSRTHGQVTNQSNTKALENIANEFLKAVRRIDIPKPPQPDLKDDTLSEEEANIEFVKDILDGIKSNKNDIYHVAGAYIMCIGRPTIPWLEKYGEMPNSMLKEMCELYLEAHHQFDDNK